MGWLDDPHESSPESPTTLINFSLASNTSASTPTPPDDPCTRCPEALFKLELNQILASYGYLARQA